MSLQTLHLSSQRLKLAQLKNFIFKRTAFAGVTISDESLKLIQASHYKLLGYIEENLPIYGVTTGFGDSCTRVISKDQSELLQENLVSYLQCGTGKNLSPTVSRALSLFRLISLSRGLSGVSTDLIAQFQSLLDADVLPVVPCEGSLGASGDLIPLAYLGQVLQGKGKAWSHGNIKDTAAVFNDYHMKPYKLKAKEGLAIVNGTSAMTAQAFVNHIDVKFLTELSTLATSWLVMVLKGKTAAFGTLINSKAKTHKGQSLAAEKIRNLLVAEGYLAVQTADIAIKNRHTAEPVQDRYSMRCTPQVLGPIYDTMAAFEIWLEDEINSVSDNPVVDSEADELALGGNFYGGYLAHGMDYYKICLGNLADLMDRQLMLLMDEKTARGLPPNLAHWQDMNESERHLHHGLKALHQSVNALTSEVLALAMPNTIFSRSSESHNQDKVSLGMSAAMQCADMVDKMYNITTLYLVCLAQALDIRGLSIKSNDGQKIYQMIRSSVPFVKRDQTLSDQIISLREKLRSIAHEMV